jgi:hypothetical protein
MTVSSNEKARLQEALLRNGRHSSAGQVGERVRETQPSPLKKRCHRDVQTWGLIDVSPRILYRDSWSQTIPI